MDTRSATEQVTGPTTATEEQVAEVWRDLLGLDAVAVDEDFFELGGHSMLAVQVIFRLAELTGVELELEDFFELGTVTEVAAELDRLRADGRPAGEPVFEGEL
ncbi:phosphopantetheine-binding protein [Umezawaea tangerina]|uniref:Acyl carrier protein n=1 Tax=Umezawaea tangerina TaxID=84725 RepID=A0A2T0TGR8_9PSEU|nr:phosphopantetheine-binding protein [Umezawaea tangerina]PRY44811.1 acyl carrier protein [Umezawaea tangerina]